jgi:hypothetical protein
VTITPQAHATWDGVSSLRGGLAVHRALEGTLGVALRFAGGQTFFTCARHVAGIPPLNPDAVEVFRGGAFQAVSSLLRLPLAQEAGDPSVLRRCDLTLLRAPADIRNDPPDSTTPNDTIAAPVPGESVSLRGCLHEDWKQTVYQEDYGPQHDPFFIGMRFRKDALGIIDLSLVGNANSQAGNSGSAIWRDSPTGPQLVGHLVAVSTAAPFGLVVRYDRVFSLLGFPKNCVIQEVAA